MQSRKNGLSSKNTRALKGGQLKKLCILLSRKQDLNTPLNSCFQVKNLNRSSGPLSAGRLWNFVSNQNLRLWWHAGMRAVSSAQSQKFMELHSGSEQLKIATVDMPDVLESHSRGTETHRSGWGSATAWTSHGQLSCAGGSSHPYSDRNQTEQRISRWRLMKAKVQWVQSNILGFRERNWDYESQAMRK